jgi:hypothetical protein
VALAGFVAVATASQPAVRPHRLALWGRCWREGRSPAVQDGLTLAANAPSWAELERVADYLRGQDVKDGDVLCYESTLLQLQLELGLRPPGRFLHPDTMLRHLTAHRGAVRAELQAGPQRFVVTDMMRGEVMLGREPAAAQRPGDPLALPPAFPPDQVGLWPYSEPVVFRAGRYYVHQARPASH